MNMNNPNEKVEIIERALQEAVGGGEVIDVCAITCSIFSIDICYIDRCSISI
jgi:hypothetical protein